MQDSKEKAAIEQAVDWYVRLDAGDLSSEERAEFQSWLAADPAHLCAYIGVEQLRSNLHALPRPQTPSIVRRKFRVYAPSLAAAAVLLIAAIFLLDLPMRLTADARSATGEVTSVILPDGSTVMLNTSSAIAVGYTAAERRVRLLRGEAYFKVSSDPARPFKVEVEQGETRALGTEFAIRRDGDRTTVTVLESRVNVNYPSGSVSSVTLSPGQRVRYGAGSGLGTVEGVDAAAETAWRRGKLMFVDQPLTDVIDELNRYHVGAIRIANPAIRDRRVSGVFQTDDPVAVVNVLEQSLGLRSTRLGSFLILLRR